MYSVLTNCSWLAGEVCIDMVFQRESKIVIVEFHRGELEVALGPVTRGGGGELWNGVWDGLGIDGWWRLRICTCTVRPA
jgi:hypothetical protein